MRKILLLLIAFAVVFCDSAFLEGSTLGDGGSFHGLASWYSRNDRGIRRHTANMERFNDQDFTCAMWGFKFGTIVEVTNIENGQSVLVRVNDRGPARRFAHHGRVIDLTKAAFTRIAGRRQGLVHVKVTVRSLT